tara:strand:+ start:14669 stop:15439 length:771 start_codon:yes stop_codon:yes gene_type:complete
MDKGWISIHRKILKNPLVKFSKKYSYAEAWLWLLLRATYSNQKVVLGADIYHLKSGEIITSQKKLRLQFGWGTSRLKTFLNLYKKDNMIDVKTNKKLTMITIINFSNLQKKRDTNESQTNHKQSHINKDKNKDNKESLKVRFEKFHKKCKDTLPNEHPEYTAFVNWWSEYNEGGSKMKWEKNKTFNLKMRWATWIRRSKSPETKKFNLDDKFPFDKTGNARLGRCSKCNNTVFLDKWKPILDSPCCSGFKVIGKGE